MTDKYYRVKKDTFLWVAGAILKHHTWSSGKSGYSPIEDIWNKASKQSDEYITAHIIEDPACADYFERVYPDTIGGKIFKTKDQLVERYNEAFKS